MINSVVLVGRLTADPELKYTNSNLPVTSFSIAIQRAYSKPGEERQSDFIDIVAWRSTAEFITKYFAKGNMIGIEGSIQTRKYQDKQGNNRTAFEIVVDRAHFVEGKSNQGQAETPSIPTQNCANNDYDDFSEVQSDDEGDLPF